jgi:hypothetical protein
MGLRDCLRLYGSFYVTTDLTGLLSLHSFQLPLWPPFLRYGKLLDGLIAAFSNVHLSWGAFVPLMIFLLDCRSIFFDFYLSGHSCHFLEITWRGSLPNLQWHVASSFWRGNNRKMGRLSYFEGFPIISLLFCISVCAPRKAPVFERRLSLGGLKNGGETDFSPNANVKPFLDLRAAFAVSTLTMEPAD